MSENKATYGKGDRKAGTKKYPLPGTDKEGIINLSIDVPASLYLECKQAVEKIINRKK